MACHCCIQPTIKFETYCLWGLLHKYKPWEGPSLSLLHTAYNQIWNLLLTIWGTTLSLCEAFFIYTVYKPWVGHSLSLLQSNLNLLSVSVTWSILFPLLHTIWGTIVSPCEAFFIYISPEWVIACHCYIQPTIKFKPCDKNIKTRTIIIKLFYSENQGILQTST